MREQGGYVSLTDSKPIRNYLASCFEWVGKAARTAGGETWMLPLYFDIPMLWTVPENFDHFGLTPADVAYFDDYLQAVKDLNQTKGDYTTHITSFENAETQWRLQYEMTYCDYKKGLVAFGTDLFRNFYNTMFTGWHTYGDTSLASSYHPILQYDQRKYWDSFSSEGGGLTADYDTAHVIFKIEYLSAQLAQLATLGGGLTDWRALPMPRLTEKVEKNYAFCTLAVVNPYSKHKEQAVAYLEAAASDMMSSVVKPVFVQKDLSAYNGHYDMSVPAYRDIYDIFSNGAAIEDTADLGLTWTNFDDYQNGKITLDEAVKEIQRQAELWLNE